ncbi:MAG TPA: transposase, partial [Bacteroidetes bacterium]|nr:transposase [Bacteroidota bacterium]
MFIRKKKNASGSVSIQIIEKQEGRNKVIKSIGSSKDKKEIDFLVKKAYLEIPKLQKQEILNFGYSKKDENIFNFVDENIKIYSVGADLVLGNIFNSIGFDKIEEPFLKKLTISRIVYPVSKLKTTEYWERHLGFNTGIQTVYDFLDRLHKNHKEEIEQIS